MTAQHRSVELAGVVVWACLLSACFEQTEPLSTHQGAGGATSISSSRGGGGSRAGTGWDSGQWEQPPSAAGGRGGTGGKGGSGGYGGYGGYGGKPPDPGPCNGGVLVRKGTGFICDCTNAQRGGPFCDGSVSDEDGGTAPGSGELALSVSTFSYTTCALMESHTVRCWGDNGSGNLGDGTYANSVMPVTVKELSNVTQLEVGLIHACALIDDGSVRCWGDNYANMLRDGTNNDRNIPVVAQGLNDVVQISIGESQSCVRHKDNRLECWIPAPREDLMGADGMQGVVDVEAGYFITAAWFEDGSVRTWGEHKLTGSLAENPVKRVASGYGFVCVLRDDGTVRCGGWNHEGQLGIGKPSGETNAEGTVTGLSGVVNIAAGFEHACALLEDGTVRCWGQNEHGQVGDGSFDDRGAPSAVVGLDHVAEVTCGREHCCALRDDGTIHCWGGNAKGQLGDGTTSDRAKPVQVQGL